MYASDFKKKIMSAAISLAEKGRCSAHPNPMVGAVVVRGKKIIAQGYHKTYGKDHAEIVALKRLSYEAKGASLFVTLEPCSTQGKTPPCTEAIIKSGITHVYIGALDPNPAHHAHSLKILKKAGIRVEFGICDRKVKEQNQAFFKAMKTGFPFVSLKLAMSMDGKIATRTGDSQWITQADSRKFVHKLRAQHDGILVGRKTLSVDNPKLTVRLYKKSIHEPYKIIIDKDLSLNRNARVFSSNSAETIIRVCSRSVSDAKILKKRKQGEHVIAVPFKGAKMDLRSLCMQLVKQGIYALLLEGGGELAGSFIDKKLVDKAYIFHAPIIVGGEQAVSSVAGKGVRSISHAVQLKNVQRMYFKKDILTIGYCSYV